jgi:GNAT superfamily N-acetyltransferase
VGVLIRDPRPADAEGLAQAARDLARQYATVEPDRFSVPDRAAQLVWYRDELLKPQPDNVVWLVAEVDGEAVGDAFAELQEPSPDAAVQPQLDVRRRRAYLHYLAVQEGHRGRGVGGRLLEAVEAWARAQGAELLATDTNLRSNVGAVEFYEHHGFERQSVVLRKRLS